MFLYVSVLVKEVFEIVFNVPIYFWLLLFVTSPSCILQATPLYTLWVKPHRYSGAPGRGWWSTAEVSSPQRLVLLWQTPCSAPRTSSPCFTLSVPTLRVCCWRLVPFSQRPEFSKAWLNLGHLHRDVSLIVPYHFSYPKHLASGNIYA